MLLALTLQVMLRLYGSLGMVEIAQQTNSSCPSSSPAAESSDSSRSEKSPLPGQCVDGKLLFS